MYYVKTHKGRHDPQRWHNLCVKTLCAVSVTYLSTLLRCCQKHYLTFLYAKHTVRQAEARDFTLWILRMQYDE
jgi:hypothetical protein